MRGRERGALAALLLTWTLARSAIAQTHTTDAPDGGAPTNAAPRTVDVAILSGDGDEGPLTETIREALGRLGVTMNAHAAGEEEPDAGTTPTGIRVRIDLASRYEAVVILRNGRTSIRRTVSRDASAAIVREEIGDAVRSVVESQLLSDEAQQDAPPPPVATASPQPSAAAPPVAEAPTPAPAERSFALDLATLAGLGPIAASSGLVARVGGGVVLASRRGVRPSLILAAAYLFPFEESMIPSVTSSRTNIVSLRAVPAIEVLHASWIALDVGAGGGVDSFSVHAIGESATVTADAHPTKFDPILTGLATAQVDLAPGVTFMILLGCDVDLESVHYDAAYAAGSGELDVLVPWHFRPLAQAGFTFTAVGPALFASRRAL
jgi:hypothetical protein